MPNIGAQELIIVLVIALLIFGPRRLPELGKSMGKGIREFKKATSELQGHLDVNVEDKPSTQATVLKEKPSGEVVTGEVLREEPEEPVKAAKG